MKTVILAGGLGTRLGHLTSKIPKPMVKVGNIPIIWHLINYYVHYGHDDFIIALDNCSTGKSPVEISIFSSSRSCIKNEK